MVERSEVPSEFRGGLEKVTERQEAYLRDLIETRVWPDDDPAPRERLDAGEMTKQEASRWIEYARDLPKKGSQFARNLSEMPDVPDGRYAIERDGVLKFYRVKIGTSERWLGFIFLDAGSGGGHGDLRWDFPIKNVAHKKDILRQIARDPIAAAKRFGQEVGICAVCGKTLTDETSRAYGIGPICRGERNW